MKNTNKLIEFLNKNQASRNSKIIARAINIISTSKSHKIKAAAHDFLESYKTNRVNNDRQEEIRYSAANLCRAMRIFPNKLSTLSDKNNEYLWRAYQVYDQILDENKNIKELPQANLNLIKYCQNLYFIKEEINKKDRLGAELFYSRAYKILEEMEKANEQEINPTNKFSLELLRPESLSKKSLGQAIPSLAIICAYNKKYLKDIISFHQYYLAARQLADDIHDLDEDRKNETYNPLLLLEKQTHSLETVLDFGSKKIKEYCCLAEESIRFLKTKTLLQPIKHLRQRAESWPNDKRLGKEIILELQKTKTPS